MEGKCRKAQASVQNLILTSEDGLRAVQRSRLLSTRSDEKLGTRRGRQYAQECAQYHSITGARSFFVVLWGGAMSNLQRKNC